MNAKAAPPSRITALSILIFLLAPMLCVETAVATELAIRNTLLAADGAEQDQFGSSVAIFAHVAVVGAYGDDDHGPASGSARVYRFDGATWVEEQKLTAGGASAFAWFGEAVAVHGNVSIIGAPNDRSSGTLLAGSASVFRFTGTGWTEEQRLEAGDLHDTARFGSSASLRGDVALIGSRTADGRVGAAYVFRFDGTHWQEEQKITPFDGMIDDGFGGAVCLGSDTAIIAAPYDNDPDFANAGSVYVFHYDGSQWGFVQKITSSNPGSTNYFGYSVSLHEDVLFVGSYGENVGGACYVYRWDGSRWGLEQRLALDRPQLNSRFGFSVSVWDDTAIVGASLHDETGVACVYRHDGSAWQPSERMTAPDAVDAVLFGGAVSLHGDLGIVGASRTRTFTGAAYGLAPSCRAGTVNAETDVQDVLRVNGEFGSDDRTVEIRFDDPLEVSMDAPPEGPPSAAFALYAWGGEPDETTYQLQPHGIGTTCFPTPLVGGHPEPARIWNNLGHEPQLGEPDHPSEPAPSTVVSLPGGLGRALTVSLQGFIKDSGSAAELPVSLTNLVTLRVR